MLSDRCEAPDARPYRRSQSSPSARQMRALRDMLVRAERPLVIVGGGDWSQPAAQDITAFVQINGLPTAASFRMQDVVNNHLDVYVGALGVGGNSQLIQRIKDADVLLVVGDRLSEMSTDDYRVLDVPRPKQTLIHVYPDPGELGRVYQPALAIVSGMSEFSSAARHLPPVGSSTRQAWLRDARADYERYIEPQPARVPLDLAAVMTHVSERLPNDAIVTNGAGQYATWCHRYLQFTTFRTQVAPTNGTMGYGTPAAIAAKLVFPTRTVACFAGDGCFLMNGQELATAVQYRLPIVFVVINNHSLGSIRMHQERLFPGRRIATDLINPDFPDLARAFGAYGEAVSRTADFPAALERALSADRPALLELRTNDGATPRS
jgi:acetolactate synthase-1/2/3 large subunit